MNLTDLFLGFITAIELCRLVIGIMDLVLKYCDTYKDPPLDDEMIKRLYC